MSDPDLYSVRDGGTLRKLDTGLEIVRRQKHEWQSSLDGLPRNKLVERTGKIWGSKFYSEWTLPVLAAWIAGVVQEEGWTLRPGQPIEVDRLVNRNIGLVASEPTPRIRVVCDGRYIHAYPVAEQ